MLDHKDAKAGSTVKDPLGGSTIRERRGPLGVRLLRTFRCSTIRERRGRGEERNFSCSTNGRGRGCASRLDHKPPHPISKLNL